MLQQDKPDDYVVATGKCFSVRDFLETAFDFAGLDPYRYLETSEDLMRPAEVALLLGDSSKAEKILKWENKIKFKELVSEMVESDLKFYERNETEV